MQMTEIILNLYNFNIIFSVVMKLLRYMKKHDHNRKHKCLTDCELLIQPYRSNLYFLRQSYFIITVIATHLTS